MNRPIRTRLDDRGLRTGYYGVPGTVADGAVHIVRGDRPVCGATLRPAMAFQHCATGVVLHYVECGNCRRWWASATRPRVPARGCRYCGTNGNHYCPNDVATA